MSNNFDIAAVIKRYMIKRNTVRKIEKIGKSLHFHRLPGVSYLYNKIESIFSYESAETWAKKENINFEKLDYDGYTLCVPLKYYDKWSDGVKKGVEVYECSEYIDEGDIVVDIGGHVGSSMIPLRDLVGDSGSVIVFEAVPILTRYLQETVDINKFKNVKIENKAVGNKNKNINLYVPNPETSQSSINQKDIKNQCQINVESITLSNYMNTNNINKFDFAKIDIEGGEYEIICESNALANIGTALIELHPDKMGATKTSNVWDKLKSSGNIYSIDGKKIAFDDISKTSTHHIIWESLD